jgi:hypothetical protein
MIHGTTVTSQVSQERQKSHGAVPILSIFNSGFCAKRIVCFVNGRKAVKFCEFGLHRLNLRGFLFVFGPQIIILLPQPMHLSL